MQEKLENSCTLLFEKAEKLASKPIHMTLPTAKFSSCIHTTFVAFLMWIGKLWLLRRRRRLGKLVMGYGLLLPDF